MAKVGSATNPQSAAAELAYLRSTKLVPNFRRRRRQRAAALTQSYPAFA